MTGPEHYMAGEAALAEAESMAGMAPEQTPVRLTLLAEAQAHFMAAQVAATIDTTKLLGPAGNATGWAEALS